MFFCVCNQQWDEKRRNSWDWHQVFPSHLFYGCFAKILASGCQLLSGASGVCFVKIASLLVDYRTWNWINGKVCRGYRRFNHIFLILCCLLAQFDLFIRKSRCPHLGVWLMCSLTVAGVQRLCPLKLIACQSHTTRSCECCSWGGRVLYSCHIANVLLWPRRDWSLGRSCCRNGRKTVITIFNEALICGVIGRQGIHSRPIHGRHLVIKQNYHQMWRVFTSWCLAEMSLSLKGGEVKPQRACDPLVWPTKIALLFISIIKI